MDLEQRNIIELRRRSKIEVGIATFIGAGCSSALQIPMWTEMLANLNKEFRYYTSDEELVQDTKSSGYAQVASNIKSKANGDQSYNDMIKKFLQPVACHFTSLHLELIRLSKFLLTTNYDESFEESFRALKRFNLNPELKFVSSSLGAFNHSAWGVDHNIFHLHGDVVSGDFILTSESYIENYNTAGTGVALLIGAIFSSYDTLFVGFSFEDKVFIDFLKRSLEQIRIEQQRYKKSQRQHYCIISDKWSIDYLTAEELLSFEADIDDLRSRGILEDRKLPAGRMIFRFAANASANIQDSTIEPPAKAGLLKSLKRIEENRERIKLLQDLKIEPIYFDGDNYLQIELILRAINDSPSTYTSTYIPNWS